jgi:hypothetical protein
LVEKSNFEKFISWLAIWCLLPCYIYFHVSVISDFGVFTLQYIPFFWTYGMIIWQHWRAHLDFMNQLVINANTHIEWMVEVVRLSLLIYWSTLCSLFSLLSMFSAFMDLC